MERADYESVPGRGLAEVVKSVKCYTGVGIAVVTEWATAYSECILVGRRLAGPPSAETRPAPCDSGAGPPFVPPPFIVPDWKTFTARRYDGNGRHKGLKIPR